MTRRLTILATMVAAVIATAIWLNQDPSQPPPDPLTQEQRHAAETRSQPAPSGPPRTPQALAPSATPSSPEPVPPHTTATPKHGDGETPMKQVPSWRRVAEGFARDFAHPGPTLAQWRHRVARWTTADLARSYATVDPRQIPSDELDSLHKTAAGVSAIDVTATYTSGLALRIRLETGPDGWKVTTVEP